MNNKPIPKETKDAIFLPVKKINYNPLKELKEEVQLLHDVLKHGITMDENGKLKINDDPLI